MRIVLLPGLDGTTRLFRSFVAALPAEIEVETVPIPFDGPQDPIALAQGMIERGVFERKSVLLAESFSGPISYALLARRPESISAMIFVASFLTRPNPLVSFARFLPIELFPWHWLPGWAAKHWCLGYEADSELIKELRETVRTVPTSTFSRRIRALSALPKPSNQILIPTLYIEAAGDQLVNSRCQQEIARLCVSFEHEVVAGPHFVLQHSPHRGAEIVSRFLRKLAG